MSGPLVGYATMQVIPSVKGLSDAISKEMGGTATRSVAEKTGSSFGSSLISGAKKTVALGAATIGASVAATAGVAFAKGWGRLKAFEEANTALASAGLNADQTKQLMDGLNDTLTGTPYALSDGAKAMTGFVTAGQSLDQTAKSMELVADAAAFGQADLGEVAGIFQKIQNNGKASADTLNQLQERGIPAMAMLSDSLGMTGEEFSKFVSSGKLDSEMFFEAWEKGAQGFGDQNIKMAGAAKNSGGTVAGAWGNAMSALGRAGATVLGPVYERLPDILTAITGKINEVTKALGPMVESFFESSAVSGFFDSIIPAIESLDVEGFVTRLGRIPQAIAEFFSGDLAGAGVSIGKVLGFEEDDDRVGKIIEFVEKFKELSSDVGSGAWDDIKNVFDALSTTVVSMAPSVASIAGTLGKASAAIGISTWMVFTELLIIAARIADVTLVPALELMAGLLEENEWLAIGLVGAFAGFKVFRTIQTGITAFSGLSKITKVATGVQKAFNMVMAANPIFLVIAAIVALGIAFYLAYQKIEPFRNFIDGIGRWIRDNLWPILKKFGNWIKDQFMKVWEELSRFWTNTLWPALQKVGGWIKNTLWPIFQTVGKWVANVFVNYIKTLINIWSNVLWPALKAVGGWIKDTLWPIFQSVVGFIKDQFMARVSDLASLWTDVLWPAFQKVIDWVKDTLIPRIESIIETFLNVKDKVAEYVGNVVDVIMGIKERISDIGDAIAGFFKAGFNKVAEYWNDTIGKLSWTVPDWVPFIGGNTISAPKLPILEFHQGGTVDGRLKGNEVVAKLLRNETVLTADQMAMLQRSGDSSRVEALLAELVDLMRHQKTVIEVNGAGHPNETAEAVARRLRRGGGGKAA